MYYLLFVVYLVLFCWLVTKIKFFQSTGLPKKYLAALFIIKLISGCVYGWIHLKYYGENDTWIFHEEGLKEYHLLFSEPSQYFTNLFENNYAEGLSRVMDSADSFWNDLRTNLISKILSIFDIFSFGNYYINIIFFNLLTFTGAICIYKVFLRIFPAKKYLLILPVFFFPSFIFFTSGIHRDGLILLGIGLIVYNMFYAIRVDTFKLKRILAILAGILIIFLFRNFVLITLFPALLAWMICERYKRFALPMFLGVYVIFIVVFFNIGRVHPKLDLPKYVSERQLAFFDNVKQSTAMELRPLFPNFRSFMNNTPQALNHSLMRPYFTELTNTLQFPIALEIFVFEVLFLLFLFFKKRDITVDSFIYFGIFFSLSMLVLIGYTIPILGALCRYRSVYFPFLLTPLICFTDWQKIADYLRINKK